MQHAPPPSNSQLVSLRQAHAMQQITEHGHVCVQAVNAEQQVPRNPLPCSPTRPPPACRCHGQNSPKTGNCMNGKTNKETWEFGTPSGVQARKGKKKRTRVNPCTFGPVQLSQDRHTHPTGESSPLQQWYICRCHVARRAWPLTTLWPPLFSP